jgi:branched-chain amino acid transport system permease protein
VVEHTYTATAAGLWRKRLSLTPVLGFVLVALLVVWLGVNLAKTPHQFLEAFLIGITNGSVYGLVALGYTLVYGILELINFAHGDVFMLGGMISISPSSWRRSRSR